ncbi:MAG: sugar ABC transporter substrate-binding protein [Thalassobaculum sp.]|uniref:sugar ABC transporter substrate-binding protein n=1 Tax=Thalassobaculum sp. TaxID=2022740 RepID=UPI0032EFC441
MARNFRLHCLTKNRTNPAYVGAQIGAARLADSLGCTLVGAAPATPDDPGEQIALLEEALASRPDAILIAPVHTTALDPTLRKVVDAGIPLVFFVASAPAIAADTFVTADNRTLAAAAAGRLFEHLGGTGEVAILEGLPQSPTAAPRAEGFRAAASGYPRIRIVDSAVGDYQHAGGRLAMARMLERHARIDGVVAANDAMALGAIAALREAGREAAVVGINAMPDAIRAIRSGAMLATVSYDALSLVCTGVHAAVRILTGRPVPRLLELPADVVDVGNCAAWDVPYEQRPLPTWESATGIA